MADLKVDYDLLTESSRSLGDINTAFDALRRRSSSTSGDWGSHDIAHAMDSFSGDWDNHRTKMMKSIEAVKGLVDEALQAFQETDAKLSSAFTPPTVVRTTRGHAQ